MLRRTGVDRPQAEQTLTPYFRRGGSALYRGDCLRIMPQLEAESFDAAIGDPPYCSGGFSLAEKSRDPKDKYCQNGNDCGRPSFGGDVKDQRSFAMWATLWMSELRRLVRPGGYCLIFTDWRQLPVMTDVLQAGGFVWRGVICWNKGRGSRSPHKGYFRHQCEYIVWGTNGRCEKAIHGGPWDGCIEEHVKQVDKFHMTGKPTKLLCKLVECVPPGGRVIDPFAGSSTSGVACGLTGREFVGIEAEESYCRISAKRLGELRQAA